MASLRKPGGGRERRQGEGARTRGGAKGPPTHAAKPQQSHHRRDSSRREPRGSDPKSPRSSGRPLPRGKSPPASHANPTPTQKSKTRGSMRDPQGPCLDTEGIEAHNAGAEQKGQGPVSTLQKTEAEASQHHSEAAHSSRREGAGSLVTSGPPGCNEAPYPAAQPGGCAPIHWRRHCIPEAVRGPPAWGAALTVVTPAALCRISRIYMAVAGAGACLPASTAAGAWG